ncbi:gamma-glutamyl cyclotransferase [Cellulophaga phage phi14:2]|uniref:Gamma-glutamyl cyclotransferase n=1 Tax=Cellulophaga phage phi14:2 TaxID=1327990 RepID=S0A0M5_9CAUD|nr:gamma-glutamyl cyclotransferase [Cellulophaga phage phi14:2]AGO48926.1 gamma-glutamyl cyclotransferase [Cellulophaga phage phi14:2]
MTEMDSKLEEIKEKYGKNSILVGVYGTLRTDQSNHALLKGNSTRLGLVETDPEYTLYHLGGFPGLVKNGETSVVLEVFVVPSTRVQQNLDYLEGYRGEEFNDPENPHSNMYNKELIDTEFGPTYIYIYNARPGRVSQRIIESGDWIKRNEKAPETETKIAN